MIREILKMGDPRLLEVAKPVERFDTPELHEIVADMFETMHHANGAGRPRRRSASGCRSSSSASATTTATRTRRRCPRPC